LHIEQSQVVKAPREQVFQAWTDYENWPKYFDFFKRITVTERTENTAVLDGGQNEGAQS